MKQLILLTAVFMISAVAFADDTITTETCADGAGDVIAGVVSGRKYCMSHNNMNWWNANAWCDSQGRRLFSLDDCKFSSTSGVSKCHDLNGIGDEVWVLTATPYKTTSAYVVNLSSGGIDTWYGLRAGGVCRALCY